MNCQRFEDVVNDLARNQMMDAVLQSDALEHSRDCATCGTRLADERAITIQLRELALAMNSVSAPGRVERGLLSAFDQRLFPSAVASIPVYRRKAWVAAIAASFLLVFGLLVARAWSNTPQEQLIAAAQTRISAGITSVPFSEIVDAQVDRGGIQSKRSAAGERARRSFRADDARLMNHVNDEVTTDFIPVTYGGSANLDSGAQLVRVELPRSRLASFGLPVNMDRADEKIKADVLVGVDGLAHAIRFVGNRRALDK